MKLLRPAACALYALVLTRRDYVCACLMAVLCIQGVRSLLSVEQEESKTNNKERHYISRSFSRRNEFYVVKGLFVSIDFRKITRDPQNPSNKNVL